MAWHGTWPAGRRIFQALATDLPGYALAFDQAWCTTVAIAADLLAWLRLLALDHHQQLRKATPPPCAAPCSTPPPG